VKATTNLAKEAKAVYMNYSSQVAPGVLQSSGIGTK